MKISIPGFNPGRAAANTFHSSISLGGEAEANYYMFWKAVRPLLAEDADALEQFDQVGRGLQKPCKPQIQNMWVAKLGLT